jgi:putative methionine-R-sulfoxide reductase with GAF domain
VESEEIVIPFLDNDKLTITFMDFEPEHDKTFIDEADQALSSFLKLNVNDRNLISELT